MLLLETVEYPARPKFKIRMLAQFSCGRTLIGIPEKKDQKSHVRQVAFEKGGEEENQNSLTWRSIAAGSHPPGETR